MQEKFGYWVVTVEYYNWRIVFDNDKIDYKSEILQNHT